MVNMNVDEESNSVSQSARDQALKLENEKLKLEEELKEWLSILSKNNVGMDDNLVDAEGYPRSDIDVYQVRHARHKIICNTLFGVRNDLRRLMREMEKMLHVIHAERKTDGSSNEDMECEISPDTPIAKITTVSTNSPADEAGLQVEDLITHFGSVNSSNFSGLSDISNIVQHSVNQIVKIIVNRGDRVVKVYLKPHSWSGPGLLGCSILPFENVER